MFNLLNETFTRVRKSTAPKVTLILLLFISLVEIMVLSHEGEEIAPQMILIPFQFMTYLVAYCSSFISRDYINGTIRNKLIYGNSRASIYFANYIVLSVTMIAILVVYSVITLAAGAIFCGIESIPSSEMGNFVEKLIILLPNLLAFTAVATMLGMLCQGLSGTIWSFFIYTVAEIVVMLINFVTMRYFSLKDATKVREFFDDFIPPSQCYNVMYTDKFADDAYKLPLYSCIIIMITMAIGLSAFRKKNIK